MYIVQHRILSQNVKIGTANPCPPGNAAAQGILLIRLTVAICRAEYADICAAVAGAARGALRKRAVAVASAHPAQAEIVRRCPKGQSPAGHVLHRQRRSEPHGVLVHEGRLAQVQVHCQLPVGVARVLDLADALWVQVLIRGIARGVPGRALRPFRASGNQAASICHQRQRPWDGPVRKRLHKCVSLQVTI